MSKPVLGLLAGLAVVAAAGRVRRGSYSHDEDKRFGTYTFGLTPQKAIKQAVAHHVGEAGTYPIEAHQGTEMLSYLLDANKVAGIHPFRFQGRHGRVGLRYTGDELVRLLAALKKLDDEHEHDEDEDDSPGMVRSSILGTLGIEEV